MSDNKPKFWIGTYLGAKFYFDYVENSQVLILDIAKHLSALERFNGACKHTYTVAQHCVILSYLVPPEEALAALGHDSPEYVTGDFPTPIKLMIPELFALEDRIYKHIAPQVGFPLDIPENVHIMDKRLTRTERDQLLPYPDPWETDRVYAPLDITIDSWTKQYAMEQFMRRYKELTGTGNLNLLQI